MKLASKSPTISAFGAMLLIMCMLAVSVPVGAQAQRQADELADGLQPVRDDADAPQDDSIQRDGDNFKSPKAADRFKRRQEALKQKIAGKKYRGNRLAVL